jgi:hypothetical protein
MQDVYKFLKDGQVNEIFMEAASFLSLVCVMEGRGYIQLVAIH